METGELRERYTDLILDRIQGVKYPSKQLMDRVELTLTSRDRAREYVDILLEKSGTRYPSLQLLDRVSRMLALVELADAEADAYREEG